jgi:hypothetical protein
LDELKECMLSCTYHIESTHAQSLLDYAGQ